ncbi:RNA polymerase sigma factor [Herpetosiphon giganteus]|uniref:RNA polymerase sigma factor n=1 Tax=Herpetosiphon giganteus TaxID=2029754 RepID=UPI00195BFDF6|nr:hypothetical protein [Herpetosiphon giganteus]MBM7845510.1 DNA-directed RNA polymerase specialized sigma24 family protein [Herpetosiphon giganteus]
MAQAANDSAIIKLLQRGDQATWRMLAEQWSGELYNLAWAAVYQAPLAQSLVNNVWANAIRTINSVDQRLGLRLWLYTLTCHVLLDHWRDYGQQPHTNSLIRELQRLPEAMHLAVLLHLRHNLSAAMIGEILGRTHRATEQLVQQGLQRLNHQLAAAEGLYETNQAAASAGD